MSKRTTSALIVFMALQAVAQEVKYMEKLYEWIENPARYAWNQEEGRSYYIPQKHLSLNGTWKFFYSETPEGIPRKFYEPGFNDKRWNNIEVPGNWEMKGYGDKLFRNTSMPFKTTPPSVPREYNPTGAYRRTFTLPREWGKDCQVFLRMEKTASASLVWINGQEVGFNEGAQEPAEYNVTPYLRPGRNTIAVHVVKYSDGVYLESQDYWRLAGIHDEVLLYATPQIRLFDWYVRTDLTDDNRQAAVHIDVDVKNYSDQKEADYRVKAQLFHADGRLIAETESHPLRIGKAGKQSVQMEQNVANPETWSAETPRLYTLRLLLVDEKGNTCDTIGTKMGFQETAIRDGVFYLNGQPVKVNAQNSHMQHPEKGHTMDEATIRKDFELLKQFNFNGVRTSHYPPVNRYMQLACKYGLYIIDECGDEAHAFENLSRDPAYKAMYLDRVRRMVLRDRNYPCVLFWSAGNESGEGEHIAAVVEEGKRLDPTRYWMYGGNAPTHPAEDIIGPRYPTPLELEMIYGKREGNQDMRPSFMDEYLSVAGNGGGSLDDFWRVVDTYPRLMGGAIWDFVSPGVTEQTRRIDDSSPWKTPAHLMGNARLAEGRHGKALDLNGHDQWVEVYQQENTEIRGRELMICCDVMPRDLAGSYGAYLTKGDYQYGLMQRGRDSLDFYLYTDAKKVLTVPLPDKWEHQWHQIIATYDGKRMAVSIDGQERGQRPETGSIRNLPFPVNIGRNAQRNRAETRVYPCDALIDRVGLFDHIVPPDSMDARHAALWLDFETEHAEGQFFSYGVSPRTYGSIWPDRTVQPEMFQMKKTGQPLYFRLTDANEGRMEVWNRLFFTNASAYETRWMLKADDEVLEEGTLEIDVAPRARQEVSIPLHRPAIVPGREYWLEVSTTLRKDEVWAPKGHEVAWEQFRMPWFSAPAPAAAAEGPLTVEENEKRLCVTGRDFAYTFDKESGSLCSIRMKDKEIIGEPLRLNLWRAPLTNEEDGWNAYSLRPATVNKIYGERLASEYYAKGLDRLSFCPTSITASKEKECISVSIRQIVLIGQSQKEQQDQYIFSLSCSGYENLFTYEIHPDGELVISHQMNPQGSMPMWLPRVGLTTTLHASLDHVAWYGRGPQENYPDRQTGYRMGIWKCLADEMFEPYLLPQDYGLRTENRWLTLTDGEGHGLRISMDQPFNFNVYPYSTDNLTKAQYPYQLMRQEGRTLNLDYETSGVGCTARGILPGYRVAPRAMNRTLILKLLR